MSTAMMTAYQGTHSELAQHPVVQACTAHMARLLERGKIERVPADGFGDRLATQGKKAVFIAGPKRHGKDTLAESITHQSTFDTDRIPFADPLKQVIMEATQCPRNWLYGTEAEREFPRQEFARDGFPALSGRQLAQIFGTEGGRDIFGSEIWADAWRGQVCRSSATLILASDTRFPNEAAMARDIQGAYRSRGMSSPGALTVGVLNGNRMEDLAHKDSHVSEKGLPEHLIDVRRICHSLNEIDGYATEILRRIQG